MLGPLLSLCVLLQLLSASLGLVDARPAVLPHGTVVMRQNTGGLTQPVSVQTQNVLQSYVSGPSHAFQCAGRKADVFARRRQSGPMMQQCTLTFTPVTGPNGEELVQEEKACTVSLMGPSASVSSPAATASTTTAASTVSTSSVAATSSVCAMIPSREFIPDCFHSERVDVDVLVIGILVPSSIQRNLHFCIGEWFEQHHGCMY